MSRHKIKRARAKPARKLVGMGKIGGTAADAFVGNRKSKRSGRRGRRRR